MRSRSSSARGVLVSWVSVNHGAAPILTALDDRESPLRGEVATVYLCWRDAPDGERERDALRETLAKLRALEGTPKVVKLPWKTDRPPTDHEALRPFVEETLRSIRALHPSAPINILLSPGTPAMHAVWLLFGSTGLVEGVVRLYQTADSRARAAGQPAVREVRVALDAWLRHFHGSRAGPVTTEDDGVLWDPRRLRSAAMREALETLGRWAPVHAPVLLVGERGTGKTTLANYLRAISPFRAKGRASLPVVVCGQFRANPELARSELFGHRKGAFTGATSDRVGLLEACDDDTLFLDEIADLDRDTQRLLMAALEGRGFHRLGDDSARRARFRLVSETNHPIETLASSALDRDFFDRVATFVLRVPPLRECREDLPELWRGVLDRAAAAGRVRAAGWEAYRDHRETLAAICEHALPGNFRDLQRAAFHLLAEVEAEAPAPRCVAAVRTALGEAAMVKQPIEDLRARLPLPGGLEPLLREERSRWIDAAMSAAEGNVSKAARLLGVKRETLRDWGSLDGHRRDPVVSPSADSAAPPRSTSLERHAVRGVGAGRRGR